ncbi:hypothetical protein QCE63_24175 [Caballeronia sp. LZ065]|uniref:hypothetical protein n=1 Tax=Caballeronia sp. LZ065 TaxID=3038571 RepID=UPI00286417DE|nr:hypothetical protein [Caballeronia sp. LZ065]MDR5782504.1 hypothetical protein [Caballeronia sp. LZ065]
MNCFLGEQGRRRLPAWTAWSAFVAALSLAGSVDYAGIGSDKQIAPPAHWETGASLPAERGAGPAMDRASQSRTPCARSSMSS